MNAGAMSVIRWGGRVEQLVAGGAVVELAQFVDLKLLAPQQLALSLYGLVDAPIPGISIEWILQLGAGSLNHIERFTVAATDVLAQIPIVMLRPASAVQISATIRSVIPETKVVRVVALIAPQSPTWLTDLACREAL
jgi:hypothetical protein